MEQVTIPKFLYDSLCEDADIVRHLAHYRGHGWIKAVKEGMEIDKKFKINAFKE